MKNKRLLKLVGAICLAALIAIPLAVSCAAPEPAPTPAPAPAPAAAESFHLKYSYCGTTEDMWAQQGMLPLKDYIEKITNGRVIVDWYPDSILHKYPDSLIAVETGITDCTELVHQMTPGRFPLMDLFSLPGLMDNQAVSAAVLGELFDKYPQFGEQYTEKIVSLVDMVCMRSDLHTVKPMYGLDDLKGKVIACMNEAGANALSQLGASTSLMVADDAYLAAQRGVIDGIFCAWGMVDAWQFHEVAPYHVLLSICPVTASLPMNRVTFEKFTPEEQDLLLMYKYYGRYNLMRGNVYQSTGVRAKLPEDSFIEWPLEEMEKVRALFSPAWEEWADDMEELGYPGHDILEDALFYTAGYRYG